MEIPNDNYSCNCIRSSGEQRKSLLDTADSDYAEQKSSPYF